MRVTLDHRRKILWRAETGQALTEFILVVPVLCFILFAIMQFAALYNHWITLTDATRVGARTAAVSRETCPGNTEQAVRDSAVNLDQSQLAVSMSACPWDAGGQVTVTATYPWSISLVGLVVADGTLTSTTKERVE